MLGVLDGVVVAVGLSLVWILALALRPGDAVLGRVRGLKGFHSSDTQAVTEPGLLIYRFNANIVFYNIDYFRERLLEQMRRSTEPLRWVVVDPPVSIINSTALNRFEDLRDELQLRDGITLAVARARQQLAKHFDPSFIAERMAAGQTLFFPTLRAAVKAYKREMHAKLPIRPHSVATAPADGRRQEPGRKPEPGTPEQASDLMVSHPSLRPNTLTYC